MDNAEFTLASRSLGAFLKDLAMLDAEQFATNGVWLSLGGVERCVVSVSVSFTRIAVALHI